MRIYLTPPANAPGADGGQTFTEMTKKHRNIPQYGINHKTTRNKHQRKPKHVEREVSDAGEMPFWGVVLLAVGVILGVIFGC